MPGGGARQWLGARRLHDNVVASVAAGCDLSGTRGNQHERKHDQTQEDQTNDDVGCLISEERAGADGADDEHKTADDDDFLRDDCDRFALRLSLRLCAVLVVIIEVDLLSARVHKDKRDADEQTD